MLTNCAILLAEIFLELLRKEFISLCSIRREKVSIQVQFHLEVHFWDYLDQMYHVEHETKDTTANNTSASYCPPLSRKRGDIKSHSSVCLSVPLSVPLSVTKTLTWLISSEVLKVEHWYLACMILVRSPFKWRHVVTLTLTFDLLQGQSCCRAGDSKLQTFHSLVATIHLRRPMAFLFHSLYKISWLAPLMNVSFWGPPTFQYASRTVLWHGTFEVIIKEVQWPIRGSYQIIWSPLFTNVALHSGARA